MTIRRLLGLGYRLLRPFLFRIDPELAHRWVLGWTMRLGRCLRPWWARLVPRMPVRVAGIELANPVGLAAGFVKDPRYVAALPVLGVGFAEVGTLTRLGQPGNPRPRLFRLPADRALVNRMGFNNPGYHAALAALAEAGRLPLALGINLGKNKHTRPTVLAEELVEGIWLFAPYADFFVVNLSSPNTPGLRDLLDPERLDVLLERLAVERERAARFWGRPLAPLLLKLHPDLDPERKAALLAWLPRAALDGVVVTNTTVRREGLATPAAILEAVGPGGLSGAPLAADRDRLVAAVRAALPPERAVIAVGGILDSADAAAAIRAGADAVELYTGLVYAGPGLVDAVLSSCVAAPVRAPRRS